MEITQNFRRLELGTNLVALNLVILRLEVAKEKKLFSFFFYFCLCLWRLSVSLSLFSNVCLFVFLFGSCSLYFLSFWQIIDLSVCLAIHLSVCLSGSLFFLCLFIPLFLFLPISLWPSFGPIIRHTHFSLSEDKLYVTTISPCNLNVPMT